MTRSELLRRILAWCTAHGGLMPARVLVHPATWDGIVQAWREDAAVWRVDLPMYQDLREARPHFLVAGVPIVPASEVPPEACAWQATEARE